MNAEAAWIAGSNQRIPTSSLILTVGDIRMSLGIARMVSDGWEWTTVFGVGKEKTLAIARGSMVASIATELAINIP